MTVRRTAIFRFPFWWRAAVPVRKIRARMVEVGRFFFLLFHVVVDERVGVRPVPELDRLRRQVEKALEGVHPRVVLDVVFTADDYWATAEGEAPVK